VDCKRDFIVGEATMAQPNAEMSSQLYSKVSVENVALHWEVGGAELV
jgi:hypothetical protein